jgi:hypothetical protein
MPRRRRRKTWLAPISMGKREIQCPAEERHG